MRAAIVGTLLWLLLCTARAEASFFDLPVIYDYRELGYVPVQLSGNQVERIDAAALSELLRDHIADSVWESLQDLGVTELEATQAYGVEVLFRPNTFDLSVRLSTSTFGTTEVDFGNTPNMAGELSTPASWAFYHNLNLGAEYNVENETTAMIGDLYSSLNIGGVKGVNLTNNLSASYEPEIDQQNFYRTDTLLFHDNPSWPMRIAAGDVSSLPSGHLPVLNKGGVSFSSSYELLQPTRRISPSTSQELIIRERAEIEIYVNGLEIGRYRISPGRYSLTDLPLGEGTNDIEVIILYASGEYEVQRFSQFYTAQLLRRGITDFSLSAGYLSEFSIESGLEYGDDLIYSGYIEHGLFSWLTLGVNSQVSDFGNIYGVSSVIGSPVGNLGIRYSESDSVWGENGSATSLEWQQRVFGAHRFGSPNLRILHENYESFIAAPWNPIFVSLDGTRSLVSYSAFVGDNFQLNFSYLDSQLDDATAREEAEVRAIYRWRGLRVGIGYRYSEFTTFEERDQEAFLNVSYQLIRPRAQRRYRASYDSLTERAQVEVSRNTRNYMGDYSYQLGHIDTPLGEQTYGTAGYNANRARFGIYGDRRVADGQEFTTLGGAFNTAVGWADGAFGWGRGGAGPFAVIKPHNTLRSSEVYTNETARGSEAKGTRFAGGLLTSRPRHMDSVITVNVPEAPVGYDWGGGQYVQRSGAVTGTRLIVGSDASYTVIGRLVDENGEGLELLVADLTGEGLVKKIFTNSVGRFVVEGLRPGTYIVTLTAQSDIEYQIQISETDEVLVRIGDVYPLN